MRNKYTNEKTTIVINTLFVFLFFVFFLFGCHVCIWKLLRTLRKMKIRRIVNGGEVTELIPKLSD